MGKIKLLLLNQTFIKLCQLLKNKLSKVSSTKSGTPTMLIRLEPSIKKRLRNSCKIPLETLDPVMSSPKKLLMRCSPHSIRTTQEQSRSQRWLLLSSNSLEETDLFKLENVNENVLTPETVPDIMILP